MSEDPLYFSINDTPRAILAVMDGLRARYDIYQSQVGQEPHWLPWALVGAGLAACGADALMGYNLCTFSLLGLVLLGIGAFLLYRRRFRRRLYWPYPRTYEVARDLIHTLRDDLHPRRPLFGHLDLTGPQQPSKLMSEGKDSLGRTLRAYRDEWLSLKGKLYDGNMLRLALLNRYKVREGYYSRGRISGKQKWKPARIKEAQELRLSLSVNPERYAIGSDPAMRVGKQVAGFTIMAFDSSTGIIRLVARAPLGHDIQTGEVLALLKATYGLLQRKGS